MICSLMNNQLNQSERFQETLNLWRKLAGGKNIYYDNAIYLSEKDHNDTKIAQAFLLNSKNAFPPKTNMERTLELNTQTNALMCDTDTLAVVCGTLANGGVCPFTGERILKSETVEQLLSLMSSCGM